ncbi:MAG: adenylyl-sulfate kinase [Promethearchaeota archaeon]
MLNFLICLVGLPSSGKSTFAKILKERLIERIKGRNVIIVDPDIIRESLTNNYFDYRKEKIVRENNLLKISEALKEGNIVISDDLNYYSSMRHDLKEISDISSLSFFIIHISTPIDFCLKWNEIRGRKIPNEVIKKVNEKFDKFDKYQWDKPFYEVDLSTIIDIKKKADEIINQIIIDLKESKLHAKKENKEGMSSNLNIERLEHITRQTVGNFLKNPKNLYIKEKILYLRKNFIKLNLDKSLTESEITNNFIKFMEKSLNQKLT